MRFLLYFMYVAENLSVKMKIGNPAFYMNKINVTRKITKKKKRKL